MDTLACLLICIAAMASAPTDAEAPEGDPAVPAPRAFLACAGQTAPFCGVKAAPLAQQARWERRDLTWSIEAPYPPGWTASRVRERVRTAFAVWSAATNLTFRETTPTKADIRVRFSRGAHNEPPYSVADDPSFDGPGSVLAHAFYPGPGVGGDVHVDSAEPWRPGDFPDEQVGGLLLLSTLIHEIGHSLGLDHDEVDPGSIMWPTYNGQISLGAADRRRIVNRYGKPTGGNPTTDPATPSAFLVEREGVTAASWREPWTAPAAGVYAVQFRGNPDQHWRLERDGRKPGPWLSKSRPITVDEAGAWAITIRGAGEYAFTIKREE